jgi:hypothetical protein
LCNAGLADGQTAPGRLASWQLTDLALDHVDDVGFELEP